MSDYQLIKQVSRTVGMYRAARWLWRHTLRRGELGALRKEIAFYSGLIRPNALCFDVGANYGSKSEIFLKLGARVVAFEPQRDCLCELRARLGPHPRLTTVNAALGSRPGLATLYVDAHRTSTSLIKEWHKEFESAVEVPVNTLDGAIAQYGLPDYCKIDVEGYEIQVFQGLSRPIPLLSFEYHLQGDGVQKMIDCLKYLSRLGDIRVNITPAETPKFGLSKWQTKERFVDYFVRHISTMGAYSYGDVFVQVFT